MYIDTNDYPDLYSNRDIQKYGRFRPLPDTTLKPSVRRELDKIENGRATLPEGDRLVYSPMFDGTEDLEKDKEQQNNRKNQETGLSLVY